jgi:Fe2+ transport system protein B
MVKQLILFLVGIIARVLKLQEKEENKEATNERQKARKNGTLKQTYLVLMVFVVIFVCCSTTLSFTNITQRP